MISRPLLLTVLVALATAVPASPAAAAGPAPVTVEGIGIPRAELESRAKAFGHDQALPLASARPYVAREAIDERWAVRDARAAGVLPSDAAVDAALTRAAYGQPIETVDAYYGLTTPQLRERVRGELAARALADRALRRTHSIAAYGRYFLAQHVRRAAHTACHSPFAPLDRCRGGRDHDGERTTPMGIASLIGKDHPYSLEINLAPLLGITAKEPDGSDYRQARNRLQRAIVRLSKPLAARVKLSNDAYAVYVGGGDRADDIAVAWVAHHLVLGHLTPVLL